MAYFSKRPGLAATYLKFWDQMKLQDADQCPTETTHACGVLTPGFLFTEAINKGRNDAYTQCQTSDFKF